MKIGIVIPYFENSIKAKERLQFLILNIMRQKNSKVNVYLVPNGSHPLWLKEIPSYIKVLWAWEANVSKARNVGIEQAIKDGCKYIGFIDADDTISSDYLEKSYKICKTNEYDYIDCRFIQNGIEVFGTEKDYNNQKNIVRCAITGCFFRTSIIKEHRFNEHKQIGEDTEFAKIIDLSIHKKGISDAMYVYTFGINPNSLIMRRNRGEIQENI